MLPRSLRARLWLGRFVAAALVFACALTIYLCTRDTSPPPQTAAQDATDRALSQRAPRIDFDNVPTPDAIASLAKLAGVRITIDPSVRPLAEQRLVTLRLRDVHIGKGLNEILRPLGLGQINRHVHRDGSVTIMSNERLARETVWHQHDVAPLVGRFGQPPPDWSADEGQKLQQGLASVVLETVSPETWPEAGGTLGELMIENGRMRVRHLPEEQRQVWHLLDQFLPRESAMHYLHDRLTGAKP